MKIFSEAMHVYVLTTSTVIRIQVKSKCRIITRNNHCEKKTFIENTLATCVNVSGNNTANCTMASSSPIYQRIQSSSLKLK